MTAAWLRVSDDRLEPRVPDAELPELWRAVVGGQWRIVDHYDRRGRRYLVAVRSERPAQSLSPRERAVCDLVARGLANKLVAHELGLSASTVAGYLASAMRKLRATGRSQLIAIWNAQAMLRPSPQSACW